jgi:hypothetical protein
MSDSNPRKWWKEKEKEKLPMSDSNPRKWGKEKEKLPMSEATPQLSLGRREPSTPQLSLQIDLSGITG